MEPFECVSNVLGSYGSVWQAKEAGCHNPIIMYVRYVSKHRHNSILGELGNNFGAFGRVWESFGSVWRCWERFGAFRNVLKGSERLNAFTAFWEHMGAFGRLGKLGKLGKHNPLCMLWYGMYGKHNGIK